MTLHSRRSLVTLALLGSFALAWARAQTPPGQAPPARPAADVFYVLPLWQQYASADEAAFTREVAELRRRLGPETPRARVGFTAYIFLSMQDWNVDLSDPAAVRRALASNIAEVDAAIARARRHGIPLCLSFITAVRERYDPLQRAAEQEDRRNMQWHADNSLARGWITHARYARKHRRVLEAYVREIGRLVANRMAKYPETLVAASGDGEVELAYDETPIGKPALTLETMQLADYSPFAVAEFRDWLRAGGLYAPGGPFAAEAFDQSARYRGDASPAADTNRDGHTLNGDAGTAFTTWGLRYFDWPLTDNPLQDPRAIPESTAAAPGWNARAESAGGFDAPRTWTPGNAWWDLWHRFRQTMIWRHNRDVARWITTSRDPETGAVVPADRWYSDQIPADYLHGASPDAPNLRFITSASAWWTADVTPYARLGITSFNSNVNGTLFRTLAGVAPHIGERDVNWGILEWNASSPASSDIEAYRSEARLIRLYRPSLVVPIFWGDSRERIQDTGFEIALKELVVAMSGPPAAPEVTAGPGRLNFARTKDGFATPAQRLRVQIAGRGRPAWTASSDSPAIALSAASGRGSTDVEVSPARGEIGAGDRRATITIDTPQSSTPRVTVPVLVRDLPAGAPPFGSIDVPAEGATAGPAFDLAGWALDDVGVAEVQVWREPRAGEAAGPGGLIRLAVSPVYGARPDVAAIYPDAPLTDRAAYTARVSLPADMRGAVRLHVLVTDVEGHVKDLGTRVVTIQGPR